MSRRTIRRTGGRPTEESEPLHVKLGQAREAGWRDGCAEGFAAAWAMVKTTVTALQMLGADSNLPAMSRERYAWERRSAADLGAAIAAEACRRFGDAAKRELKLRGWVES